MEKITRAQANKALQNGLFVYAVPSKLRPDSCMATRLDESTKIDNNWVQVFKHYNCNAETGNGISFYLD